MYSEKQALLMIKTTKMLITYLIFFSKIRNTLFQVQMIKTGAEPNPWEVKLALFPATMESRRWVEGKATKIPLTSDFQKLMTLLELCPAIVVIDKEVKEEDPRKTVRCTIKNIDYNLDFIRSDFYKE
jgi:hypothetical protein